MIGKLEVTLAWKDTAPDPASPSNRPSATTGFLPDIGGKLKIEGKTQSAIKFGAALETEVTVDLPRAIGTIVASEDK